MKLSEIIAAARQDLDDAVAPFLWSEAFLAQKANEGEREAARRARLITDSYNPQVARIQTVDGQPLYALDPRVIFVMRVMSSERTTPIRKVWRKSMDNDSPGWESHEGRITHYLSDMQSRSLRFYKVPVAAVELPLISLTVMRLPLADMELASEPEIPDAYHLDLRHWMVRCAFMKPGEDTYRPDKAKLADSEFVRVFGNPSSAVDEEWIRVHHGYDEDEGIF